MWEQNTCTMHNSKSCIGLILKSMILIIFFLNYSRNCFKSTLPLTTPQSFKRCNTHHIRISKCLINDNETVNPQIYFQVNNYGRHGWESSIFNCLGCNVSLYGSAKGWILIFFFLLFLMFQQNQFNWLQADLMKKGFCPC